MSALIRRALASPQHPIVNEVLSALNLPGAMITTNTPGNAQLRAPFQGVSLSAAGASVPGFGQTQTTAQSTYNSLQLSVTRRLSKRIAIPCFVHVCQVN